jgi:hypothetical protein
MHIPPELLPVIQITLPIVAAIFIAGWLQNKRLDDLIGRVTAIEARLLKIEEELKAVAIALTRLENRVTRLEERIPPLVRR